MELKLANTTLTQTGSKAKTACAKISCESLLAKVKDGHHTFYFDKENSHKDMQKACAFFQKAGKSVYLNEVKYGLDEKSYIYEFRVI